MEPALVQLATIRYRDLDPFSTYPLIVFMIALAIGFIFYTPRIKYTLWRQITALISCLVFTAWLSEQLHFGRWSPGADVELGVMIGLAFCFGYGLSAIHGPSKIVATIAGISSAYPLSKCLVLFTNNTDWVLSDYFYDDGSLVFFSDDAKYVHGLLITLWLVFAIWHALRLKRDTTENARMLNGLCPACAYNLRGSIGKTTCPECGEAIDWGKVVIQEQASMR